MGEEISKKEPAETSRNEELADKLYRAYQTDQEDCEVREQMADSNLTLLYELGSKWQREEKLKGKTVLLNGHMTWATLPMIYVLLSAGAEVDTSAIGDLVVHDEIRKVLRGVGVAFYEGEVPKDKAKDHYDVVYDCGAGVLNKVQPKMGSVELTRTNPDLYNNISHPVINADDSSVKVVETGLATGDGCVRAIKLLYDDQKKQNIQRAKELLRGLDSLTSLLGNLEEGLGERLLNDVHGKLSCSAESRYVVIGYGKVGRGVCRALTQADVKKENITVVDVSQTALLRASQFGGHQTIKLVRDNERSVPLIRDSIQKADFVITATGIAGVVSSILGPEDFPKRVGKINMGTHDEWGDRFPESGFLGGAKSPINFQLCFPTKVDYLDPIFRAYLEGGAQLLTANLSPELHPLEVNLNAMVLKDWLRSHPHEKQAMIDLLNVTIFDEVFFARPRSGSDPKSTNARPATTGVDQSPIIPPLGQKPSSPRHGFAADDIALGAGKVVAGFFSSPGTSPTSSRRGSPDSSSPPKSLSSSCGGDDDIGEFGVELVF